MVQGAVAFSQVQRGIKGSGQVGFGFFYALGEAFSFGQAAGDGGGKGAAGAVGVGVVDAGGGEKGGLGAVIKQVCGIVRKVSAFYEDSGSRDVKKEAGGFFHVFRRADGKAGEGLCLGEVGGDEGSQREEFFFQQRKSGF